MGGSSDGIIDKITIEAQTPSAFVIEHVDTPTYRESVALSNESLFQQESQVTQFKRNKNKSHADACNGFNALSSNNHSIKKTQLIDLTNIEEQ